MSSSPAFLINDLDVRLRPIPEQQWQFLSQAKFASRELYRLRLQAEHAMLVSGFDELVCLDLLKFTPFDYQVHAAQIALRRFRGRGALCDEVGLGKTIEAGLVLKEYLVRNIVQRALIITPAALVEQWREELATKFDLPDFITTTDPQFRAAGPHAWEQFPRLIASLATARRAEHRPRIVQIPYDLVIVDEAHHLKNRASASWKFVNELQRKYLLLLTATPVENNLDELYNLITLLKPGQLSTPREFRRRFVVHGDPRHLKNRAQLRELLGDVMVRHSRSQVNIQLPPRRANTVRLQLTPPEADFYAAVSAMVRSQFQNQAGSAYLDEIGAFPDSNGSALKQTDRFTLLTLQREIGSSPQAAESTLRSLAARATTPAQRDQLSSLAAQSGRISTWAKADALEKLLHSIFREGTTAQNRTEKVLIFTHFRRTLELLATRLQAQGVDFVAYHGELTAAAKQQAIDDFESHVQVLLSTEAAGEGRNLQFCRTMVNFDIPWNPMRIEQRVGRIHRVGQDRPVQIYNLSARGTVEDYLLQLIDQKLNMFELVIGEMDMILGHLTDERDFEDVLIDVWLQGRNESEIQAGFNQLGDRLIQARQAYQASRDYDEALFGEDFSTE